MTRTGALLWKEWRDQRAALLVFAALVPLVSWPTQKWVLKFSEPVWTWEWVVPICVAPCIAVVAADSLAMDLATQRMAGLASLPTPLSRHFSVRALFLLLVAVGIASWAGAVNLTIAAVSPRPEYLGQMLGAIAPSAAGFAGIAAVAAGVLVFSALGVGGFRAAIGGALLAWIAYVAVRFAGDALVPRPAYTWTNPARTPTTWCIAAAVLAIAAHVGFLRSRAVPQLRRRGVLVAAAILVGALGLPASAAAWTTYRGYTIRAGDEDALINALTVSPDGRYAAVVLQKASSEAGYRSFIVRTDGTAVFDWPRRNDYVAGWTRDGLAWVGRMTRSADANDRGVYANAETGRVVAQADAATMRERVVRGLSIGAAWGHWMQAATVGEARVTDGIRVTDWKLVVRGTETTRTVASRTMPAPTDTVGQVLVVDARSNLCLVDLAGGEPRVVAEHVKELHGQFSGSPDGRYHLVGIEEGQIVLDGRTWQRVAGPFTLPGGALWCTGAATRAVLVVIDGANRRVDRFIDVAAGRDIPVDPSLEIAGGWGGVHVLPDGTLLARTGATGVVILGGDGKLVRRLFPPQD